MPLRTLSGSVSALFSMPEASMVPVTSPDAGSMRKMVVLNHTLAYTSSPTHSSSLILSTASPSRVTSTRCCSSKSSPSRCRSVPVPSDIMSVSESSMLHKPQPSPGYDAVSSSSYVSASYLKALPESQDSCQITGPCALSNWFSSTPYTSLTLLTCCRAESLPAGKVKMPDSPYYTVPSNTLP